MLFVKLSSHKKVSAGAGRVDPQIVLAGTTLQRCLRVWAAKAHNFSLTLENLINPCYTYLIEYSHSRHDKGFALFPRKECVPC